MDRIKLDKKSKDRLAIGIILITLVALSIPFILKVYLSKKPVLDEQTLCPPNATKIHIVVLLDKSDKWGHDDIVRVKNIMRGIYHEVPAQGRLTVYGIIGQGRQSTDVTLFFDMCNPGSEEECSALYQNCKRIKKRYEGSFEHPLLQITETLMIPGESSYSPLLETVTEIVNENRSESLVLHIISDFMENGVRFRFYDVIPLDEEMIQEYPLPRNIKMKIEGYFIQRRRHPMELQNAVQSAWTNYFGKQGISVSFKPIFVTD